MLEFIQLQQCRVYPSKNKQGQSQTPQLGGIMQAGDDESPPPAARWEVNLGVPSQDRSLGMHTVGYPSVCWLQRFHGLGKAPVFCEAPTLQNPGGLGGMGPPMECGVKAPWRRSHPTVKAGKLRPAPSAAATWGHMARRGTKPFASPGGLHLC